MTRICGAKLTKYFKLVDNEISSIYESYVNEWSNGGAYVPIPSGHKKNQKVYVVVCK